MRPPRIVRAPQHLCFVAPRCTLCVRRSSTPSVRVRAKSADADDEPELSTPGRSQLSATVRRAHILPPPSPQHAFPNAAVDGPCLCRRRKQQQVQLQIDELGMEALQDRLQSAAETPANPPYRLATLIQVRLPAADLHVPISAVTWVVALRAVSS